MSSNYYTLRRKCLHWPSVAYPEIGEWRVQNPSGASCILFSLTQLRLFWLFVPKHSYTDVGLQAYSCFPVRLNTPLAQTDKNLYLLVNKATQAKFNCESLYTSTQIACRMLLLHLSLWKRYVVLFMVGEFLTTEMCLALRAWPGITSITVCPPTSGPHHTIRSWSQGLIDGGDQYIMSSRCFVKHAFVRDLVYTNVCGTILSHSHEWILHTWHDYF